MRKIYYLMLLLLLISTASMNAQVTIGTNSIPHKDALLDLQQPDAGTKMGLKFPIVSLSNANLYGLKSGNSTTAIGMAVYNSNEGIDNGFGAGLYIWNGTKWMFASSSVVPVTSVSISAPNGATSLNVLGTLQLSANVQPANASNKTVMWSIINGSHASVNQTGLVSGISSGNVTVQAMAQDGSGKTATYNLTVNSIFAQDNPSPVAICYGKSATFNLAPATGTAGNITYKWEQSTNGTSWRDADGINNGLSYATPNLYTNTYYHRIAVSSTDGSLTSNTALVTVSQEFMQPNPADAFISSGSTHTFTLTAAYGGGIGISHKWEESENGTQWNDAPGTNTDLSYTTPALTSSRYYRRVAISPSCGTIYSAVAKVFVEPAMTSVAGTNGTYRVVCYPNHIGCWMVDNSKEGTSTAQYYNNIPSNANGYYYTVTQSKAANVCPSGFHLPSDNEWNALVPYIRAGNDDTNWRSSWALAGYKFGSQWYHWEAEALWWSSSSSYYAITKTMMGGPYNDNGHLSSIRCLKSN